VDGSLWEPSSRSRICSQHFVGGEKSEHPNSPAYIPTIFPEKYYGTQKNTKTVQLRAQNSLDIIQPLEPRFRETATQVNFYEEKVNSTIINMFSIIREKGVTCEAGTQSNISIEKSEKKKNYNLKEYG
ncbi:hypothetical protein PV325_013216, partial [Microctonus aethiopoides]